MLKKLLRYCFFSIFFVLLSCAPKVAPPPLYKDVDLSLEEVITIAHGDINVLRAVVGINMEKDNRPYSYVDASLLLKKPGWLHMRLYRFGMLVGNFLIKDKVVHISSGKGSGMFKKFGKELYYSVFWWEDLENALMYKQGNEYVIRVRNKEIRLDKSTLLPESQEITANSKKIYILYDKPQKEADFWYPSVVKIEIGAYTFIVKIEKLFINPSLEENDFKEPVKQM